jgi:signal transduction histidine kinase/CheY-like chemotaxis protein/HPt (histidine-containing phosphotransfer) domain-containing protein
MFKTRHCGTIKSSLGRSALFIGVALGMLNVLQGTISLINLYRSRNTVNALNSDTYAALYWAGKLKGVAKDQRIAIIFYLNSTGLAERKGYEAEITKAEDKLREIREKYPKFDPRDRVAIETSAEAQGRFFRAWEEIRNLVDAGKKQEATEVYNTKLMQATLDRRKMEDYLANIDKERGDRLSKEAIHSVAVGIPVVWGILILTVTLGAGAFWMFVSTVRRSNLKLEKTNDRLAEETARSCALAREADAANAAKSEFLAVMSHEIRTPVSGVIGLLDLLRKLPLEPRQSHYAGMAQENAEHLLVILDEILDTAKIESGKLSIEAIPFRLRTEVNHALATMRVRAGTKGLEFDVSVAAAVPPVIVGDPTRLRQMISNLVSNALKFTERGGIYVDVRREPANDDALATIRVSVRDTGIGIPAELQERLFAKFQQADVSTSRQYGGTGLGLSIVKSLAERMGGSIGVESIPGVGSTFFFTLRLPVGSDRDVPLPEPAAAHPAPVGRLAVRLRLLGAEDDPSNREIIRYMLGQMGQEIEFSENGRQAVDHLTYDRFDAVLMDNRMPVMDGFEATRLIRNPESGVVDNAVYIIAITANASQAYREKCLAAGMNDYLTKPVREAALRGALERVIAYQRGRGIELPSLSPDAAESAASPSGMTEAELIAAVEAPAAPPDPLTQFPAETLRKIALQYLERTPLVLAEMRAALDAGDLESLGRGAHSLKSNSWYVRGKEMSEICAELEARADAEDCDDLRSLVEHAEQAFARLRPTLEKPVGSPV